jgi:hypothetical protein
MPVHQLFSMAMATNLGDGSTTLFWKDRWLHGQILRDLAPLIFEMIPKRIANKRTVAEALTNALWLLDIRGMVNWDVILEYLSLWELLSEVHL